MIGFLKKDVYALVSLYKRNLALILVLYAGLSLATGTTFFLYFLVWLLGFYSLSAMSLDDSCGWDCYARTLPASARQVVGARYLVVVGLMAVGVVLALGIAAVGICMGKHEFEGTAATIPAVAAVALAAIGLMLPAAYRWGIEKARNGFLALFLLVFLVPLLMERGVLDDAVLERAALWLADQPEMLLIGAMLAIGIVVCALGFAISCRVYRAKKN